MNIVINGRTLLLPLNGIPRYASEVVKVLDNLANAQLDIEVVLPAGESFDWVYKNIKLVELPQCAAWDYRQAERYAKRQGALYVNIASKGVLYRNSVATFFDIRPLSYGDGKSTIKTARTKFKFSLSYWLAVHRAKRLVTISAFSESEMLARSKALAGKTLIAGCGWEHMQYIQPDDQVFLQHPAIQKQSYYLCIGSIAPHKNLAWINENAKLYPQNQYLIVGDTDKRLWSDTVECDSNNVHYVGYQNDARMKALLLGAKALVFPSFYEGFGIPPLEALACGIPAIVSDIPVMREIFGRTVHYLDPTKANLDLEHALKEPVDAPDTVLKEHSWSEAGKKWLALLREEQGDNNK